MQNNNEIIKGEDAYDKLLDMLQTDGVVECMLFEQLADVMLKELYNYEQSDLENMSVYDVQERVGDIFSMILEEGEDGNVHLIEYIKGE
jgi:hypothetical protein